MFTPDNLSNRTVIAGSSQIQYRDIGRLITKHNVHHTLIVNSTPIINTVAFTEWPWEQKIYRHWIETLAKEFASTPHLPKFLERHYQTLEHQPPPS